MAERQYIVGSGWWCPAIKGTSNKRGKGHPYTRSVAFHKLWYHMVHKYTTPYRIVMVDSASKYAPPWEDDIEVIHLDKNYQQPFCTPAENFGRNGWMRGFTLGMLYAWHCNSDFLYIEQDCLVVGEGWLAEVYNTIQPSHIMVGDTHRVDDRGIPWKLQQSLVFVPRGVIPRFFWGLAKAKGKACEVKFVRAGVAYQYFPFGVGRARPIPVGAKHFYAQHWNKQDLLRLSRREGLQSIIDRDLERYA